MTVEPISVVTYPDYDHNSELKVVLVADTPLIPLIIELLEIQDTRISIHCITNADTDFEWIANTVNQGNFIFVSKCSRLNRMTLGWILGRTNVWHDLETAVHLNTKYSTTVISAITDFLNLEVK